MKGIGIVLMKKKNKKNAKNGTSKDLIKFVVMLLTISSIGINVAVTINNSINAEIHIYYFAYLEEDRLYDGVTIGDF